MGKTENYDPQEIRTVLEEILHQWIVIVYICTCVYIDDVIH